MRLVATKSLQETKIMDKLKNGKIRVYTDHTGRWYNDYTQEEYDAEFNSPEMVELRATIQEIVDEEMIEKIKDAARRLNIPLIKE